MSDYLIEHIFNVVDLFETIDYMSYMSAIFYFIAIIYQHVNSTNKMLTTYSQQV